MSYLLYHINNSFPHAYFKVILYLNYLFQVDFDLKMIDPSITKFSIDELESRRLNDLLKWILEKPHIRPSEGTGEQLHNIIKIFSRFIISFDYLNGIMHPRIYYNLIHDLFIRILMI